jgi:flagellar M-ring protein FliF
MLEFLRQFITQIQANFTALPPGKRIAVASIAIGTLLGIVLLVVWSNQIEYQPLYYNMNQEDAGLVVEELKAQKIPYRLAGDGKTVMVPAGRVYDLRLDLASRGMPSGGGVGFEIFDRADLGTTEFVQKLNYQRALQGELSRTINQFAEVEQSRVHITLPEKTLFLEDEQKPTASVVVNLRRKGALREKQVQGIIHLVAGSVEGLQPENITIVDMDGNVLSAGMSGESNFAGLTSSQQEFQNEFESGLEKRVQTMLERVVGKGKAIVRVTASLDFKQEEKTEEIFDPDSAVIRSEQLSDERSKGNAPVAMGVPGVQANLPETAGAASPGVSSNEFKKTNGTMNYEINKVVTRTIQPTGTIRNLSVAVLLDGNYELTTGEDGKEIFAYVARSDEEIKKYKNIVMKAVGYNLERGDQIEVSSVPFEAVRLTEEEQKGMMRDTLMQKVWTIFPYLVFLVLCALVVVFVLRPLVKWITRPDSQVGMLPGASSGRPLAELSAEGPQQLLRAGATAREQAAHIANADAKQFADLLKRWVQEE